MPDDRDSAIHQRLMLATALYPHLRGPDALGRYLWDVGIRWKEHTKACEQQPSWRSGWPCCTECGSRLPFNWRYFWRWLRW